MSNAEMTPEQSVETTSQENLQPAPAETTAPEAVAETPAAESTPVIAEEMPEQSAEAVPAEEKEDPRALRKLHYENVFNALKAKKEANETVTVEVKARIRGGLRVIYDEMPLFLPASHYGMKKNPGEEELQDAIGKSFDVSIHELQEAEDGRRTVIVSRRDILAREIRERIKVGDIIEGPVSSVATFGVFVDLGGVEGLIHVSRLSQFRVDPMTAFKRGDVIKAVIVDIDHEKNKIALSRKELEESPWKNVNEEFPAETIKKGIVRRLTDFGAYVELKPGIDGLLRAGEISWTKRIKKPADVLTIGQEIDVYIIQVNEENQTVSLSLRRTEPNPWNDMAAKYSAGTEMKGIVQQVMQQGAIVRLGDEIDGFVPRSKMRSLIEAGRINVKPGDELDMVVSDIVPADESLILMQKSEEGYEAPEREERGDRRERGDRGDRPERGERRERRDRDDRGTKIDPVHTQGGGSFTIGDILSDRSISLINKTEE